MQKSFYWLLVYKHEDITGYISQKLVKQLKHFAHFSVTTL